MNEMRVPRGMSGVARKDNITNEHVTSMEKTSWREG